MNKVSSFTSESRKDPSIADREDDDTGGEKALFGDGTKGPPTIPFTGNGTEANW